MSKKTPKSESKKKLPVTIIAAIIGGGFIVLAACISLFGTFISTWISYSRDVAQVETPTAISTEINSVSTLAPLSETASITSTPLTAYGWINNIPLIGEQLDFSVGDGHYGTPENIPNFFNFKSSPYEGIYLSDFSLDPSGFISYEVEYQDGERIRAQTDMCLINIAYSENSQSPLNFKVNEIVPTVSVFVDERYELAITGMELIITNYTEPRMDFDKVWIMFPGAGGMGLPFKSVRTQKISVTPSQETYIIDFRRFNLNTISGVNIFVPILMTEPGKYQFQTKIHAIAYPIREGDDFGPLTLTSGRFSYEWVEIDDPRNYKLDDVLNYDGGSNFNEPNLVPCP
jgi:hypothetical protein